MAVGKVKIRARGMRQSRDVTDPVVADRIWEDAFKAVRAADVANRQAKARALAAGRPVSTRD